MRRLRGKAGRIIPTGREARKKGVMRYKDDPRWLVAKFGKCAKCGKDVRGLRVAYFPREKRVYCETCGEADMLHFAAAAFDESQITGQW